MNMVKFAFWKSLFQQTFHDIYSKKNVTIKKKIRRILSKSGLTFASQIRENAVEIKSKLR